jgi:hypothetical protein
VMGWGILNFPRIRNTYITSGNPLSCLSNLLSLAKVQRKGFLSRRIDKPSVRGPNKVFSLDSKVSPYRKKQLFTPSTYKIFKLSANERVASLTNESSFIQ